MAAIESSLRLEIAQYQAALRKAQDQIEGFRKRAQSAGSGLDKALFGGITKGAAGIGAALGAGFGVKSIVDSVVAMEKLEKMMAATEGSTAAAAARLDELREIARSPGLSFEQVVQGDVSLRAVGISAEQSARAITEFGNQLALVGGSKDDLGGVLLALTQIAASGTVFAQDIQQIGFDLAPNGALC